MKKPTRTIKKQFKAAETASKAKGWIAGVAGTVVLVTVKGSNGKGTKS